MAALEEDYGAAQVDANHGDVPVLCVISRTLVYDSTTGLAAGLPPLSLEYWDNELKPVRRVVVAGPGTTTFRTQWADSPYVDGEYPVTAVRGNIFMPFRMRIYGNTQQQMESRVAQVMRAMEQFTFALVLTVGNLESTFTCWAANGGPTGPSGAWDSQNKRSRAQEYAFTIPRLPRFTKVTV